MQVPRGINFGDAEERKVATVLFGIAGVGDDHLELIQKSRFSALMSIMSLKSQMHKLLMKSQHTLKTRQSQKSWHSKSAKIFI